MQGRSMMKTQSVISVSPSAVGVQRKEMSEPMYLTGEIERLTLQTALDAITTRALIRRLANSVGYNVLDQVRISSAIFEIARDIVAYAGRGEIIISWREDTPQRKGLHFFCHDGGLNDPRLTAMFQAGGKDTHNKLNFLGLRKLVDEFSFTKDPEHGNCVTIMKWIDP